MVLDGWDYLFSFFSSFQVVNPTNATFEAIQIVDNAFEALTSFMVTLPIPHAVHMYTLYK